MSNIRVLAVFLLILSMIGREIACPFTTIGGGVSMRWEKKG